MQLGQTVTNLTDGATFNMPADAVGLAVTASLSVTYRGATSAAINAIDLTGSLDFSASGLPDLPVVLQPNQSFTLNLRFQPVTSGRPTARLTFNYNEGRTFASFGLNLAGTAPEFAFSYLPPGGNSTLLLPSGTIPFGVTPINTTATAVVVLTNRGSGAGVVNSISIASGPEYQLVGVPLPNTSVDSGKDLRFNVTFAPKQLQPSKGVVTVAFVDRSVAFNLDGSGSGAQYAYDVLQDSTISAVLPNQLLALPDAVVGEKSSMQVRFRNTGNADGRITTISIQGTGFTLSDLPFLPLTLTPGSAATLTVTFAPTQPGRITGRLRIGDDTFDVAGTGLGATLAYSFVAGPVTTTVQNNGTVVFTPVAVGSTSSVRFLVTNSGTAPASINSISITTTGTVFTLADVPTLPVTLQPGGVAAFTVNFAPAVQGSATATLKLDTVSFTLSATGNPPPALPEYRIEGASGNVDTLQQFSMSLTLARAYPLALNGVLTLAFNSDVFNNDPSVQFGPGGRTINFTIPANTTRAIFPNNQNTVRLQTGSVAGTITLTPSFTTTDGGINLTPANPPSLNLTIPQSAPRLLNVQLSAKTATSVTLLVSGYASGRSITQMDFTFTPTAEENVGTTKLSLNVEASFIAWYQSTASQAFGSLFTATVPFTLAGDVKKVTNVSDTIQSVSVTLTNRQGTSSARSVDLR